MRDKVKQILSRIIRRKKLLSGLFVIVVEGLGRVEPFVCEMNENCLSSEWTQNFFLLLRRTKDHMHIYVKEKKIKNMKNM